MTRNLKVLIVAAMALGVFGAFNAAGAQAAEEFHCSVAAGPCKYTLKPDGAASTAHHVIVVKNAVGESVSLTCNTISGEGTTVGGTAAGLTITGIAYQGCKAPFATTAIVDMNGCDYQFGGQGGGNDQASATIICPAGKKIEITIKEKEKEEEEEAKKLLCTFRLPAQGPLKGVGYHNVVNGMAQREITATIKLPGLKVEPEAAPGGNCGMDLTKTPITGEYTTGNTLITAEEDKVGGAMVEGWWE